MNTLAQTLRTVKAIVIAKTIKGNSFVGVREYTNKQGEVSNQTLRVGYNHLNMMKADFEKLKAVDTTDLVDKYGKDVVIKAHEELLTSFAKRLATDEEKEQLRKENDSTMNRSDAQNNAYTTLAKGIRQHADGTIHITGICERKTVLVPAPEGSYKTVNSAAKTLCKKEITKRANLTSDKIRTFHFANIAEMKAQGFEI